MIILATVPASGGSLVDLDATVLIQLGIFLVMFLLLRSLLFKPVVRLIEARREATEGAREAAQSLDTESAKLIADADDKIAEIRAAAVREREGLVDQARSRERELIQIARDDCQQLMDQTRAEAETAAVEARRALSDQTKELAEAVMMRVLGRPAGN